MNSSTLSKVETRITQLKTEFDSVAIYETPNVFITVIIAESGCDLYYEVYEEDELIFSLSNDMCGDGIVYGIEMVLAEALVNQRRCK